MAATNRAPWYQLCDRAVVRTPCREARRLLVPPDDPRKSTASGAQYPWCSKRYVAWRDVRRRSVTKIHRSGFRQFRNIRGVRGSKRSSGWSMSALPPKADIKTTEHHAAKRQ